MIRVWIIFGLWLVSGWILTLHAETDPRAIEFIKGINERYYSPRLQGLKGFTCDVNVTFSDICKKDIMAKGTDPKVIETALGRKYSLTVDGNALPSVGTEGTSIDMDNLLLTTQMWKLDHLIENELKNCANTWFFMVFGAIFNSDVYKDDCSFEVTPTGVIRVSEKSAANGEITQFDFDQVAKLPATTTFQNGVTVSAQESSYSLTPHGYQLDSLTDHHNPLTSIFAFTYGPVGKYTLPTQIVETDEAPPFISHGHAVTFEFSNYQLKE